MLIPQNVYVILVLEISQPGRWDCELRMYYLSCKYLLLFILKMPQSCQFLHLFSFFTLCYFRVVIACLVCAELFSPLLFVSSTTMTDVPSRKNTEIILHRNTAYSVVIFYAALLHHAAGNTIEANAIVDL